MSAKVSVNTFRPICFVTKKYPKETCDLCSCSLYEHPPQSQLDHKIRVIVVEKNNNYFHKDCENLLEEYLKNKKQNN